MLRRYGSGGLIIGALSMAVLSFWAALTVLDGWAARIGTVNLVRLKNDAVVSLSKVIPLDPTKAKHGTAVIGMAFVPTRLDASLQIHIRAYASASSPNLVVAALFRSDQDSPLLLTRRAASDNKRVTNEETIDVRTDKKQPIEFTFRIGPAYEGSIVLNGPEGTQGSSPETTEVEITELE